MLPPGGCISEVFFSWGQRERGGGGEDPDRQRNHHQGTFQHSSRLPAAALVPGSVPRAEIIALAVPSTHLRQSVSTEASGPREGMGHSHGHQRQEPLRLV